jgi:hypothetical protein
MRPNFAHQIPVPPLSPPPPRPGRAIPPRSRRAREATARHMAFLHDRALRYADTLEGQLGDTLFFDDCVDISIFGSKTDQLLAGQPAAMPLSA